MGYFVLICGFICWSLVHELASISSGFYVRCDRSSYKSSKRKRMHCLGRRICKKSGIERIPGYRSDHFFLQVLKNICDNSEYTFLYIYSSRSTISLSLSLSLSLFFL